MADADDRERVFSYLEQRFGIPPDHFGDFLLLARKKSWWLLRDSTHLAAVSRLKVVSAGLRAFQRVGRFLKPTTRLIQLFGSHASKSVIQIDAVQLKALKKGDTLEGVPDLENGYVIFSIDGQVIGLGLQIDGKIHSQLPRKDTPSLNP